MNELGSLLQATLLSTGRRTALATWDLVVQLLVLWVIALASLSLLENPSSGYFGYMWLTYSEAVNLAVVLVAQARLVGNLVNACCPIVNNCQSVEA